MANYFGAPQPQLQQRYGVAGSPKLSRRPNRLNGTAICLCLFFPWLLFCLMYSVMSFSMHYTEKASCYLCVIMGFMLVVGMAKLAIDATKRQDSASDPSWFVFLAVASFAAWSSGVVLGDLNFFYNLEPYYSLNTLNSYPSVDPSSMSGQQLMDAGKITFVDGSRLELSKSMAFRNADTYCVAPIVGNSTKSKGRLQSYDFWAVGLNCCSGKPGAFDLNPQNFGCGEYNNPHALSGLRVMRDDQRAFYRLAVQQAEATYNIKASHPLFLYWMQDPVAEISAYADEGWKYYLFGVCTSFAVLLFSIIVALVVFSKLG